MNQWSHQAAGLTTPSIHQSISALITHKHIHWQTLTVPRTHNRFGDRSFAVAGTRLCNSLPISLRQISSYGQFRRYLKNHLFGIWEITAQCDAWFSALYKYYSHLLTYLLTYTYTQTHIHWQDRYPKRLHSNNTQNLPKFNHTSYIPFYEEQYSIPTSIYNTVYRHCINRCILLFYSC